MARPRAEQKEQQRAQHETDGAPAEERRCRPRRRSRRKSGRARRRAARGASRQLRSVRRDADRVRDRLGEAGGRIVGAGQLSAEQLREAGTKVLSAGEAGADLARDAASLAGDRLERAAVGAERTAVEIGVQLMSLPELARDAARKGVELVEEAGTKAVASVLHTGSRVLEVAADYMSELAPRRRVNRAALERLVVEQIAWARTATALYDRVTGDVADDATRVALVRLKLQMIRQVETLAILTRRIGGSMPKDERLASVEAVRMNGGGQADGRRHRMAQALSVAMHSAAGWRALGRIASLAESDQMAGAIAQAIEAIGREPDEQVDVLCDVLLRVTVDTVLA